MLIFALSALCSSCYFSVLSPTEWMRQCLFVHSIKKKPLVFCAFLGWGHIRADHGGVKLHQAVPGSDEKPSRKIWLWQPDREAALLPEDRHPDPVPPEAPQKPGGERSEHERGSQSQRCWCVHRLQSKPQLLVYRELSNSDTQQMLKLLVAFVVDESPSRCCSSSCDRTRLARVEMQSNGPMFVWEERITWPKWWACMLQPWWV